MRGSLIFVSLALLAACGGGAASAPAPSSVPKATASTRTEPAAVDPLGPRPEPATPPPFTPPTPVVYRHARGFTVWLLERHALPIVSIQTVVPAGAKSDPQDRGGLAWATANMLDEGAGKRGAIAIASDLDRLGATLATGAYADYSFAHLTVLKKNLAEASGIYGDVLAKPTFSPVEWQRVHGLWMNDLRQRQSDPSAVAGVVVNAKVMAGDPYAHPTNGTTKSAAKVTLAEAKSFYDARWRPEIATLVVVGDVTRAELDPLLDSALADWKSGAKSASPVGVPPTTKPARRFVLVDRPDAPQSVIAVGRRGVTAGELHTSPVTRVNAALGGSFTSRLNQDLREEHGWSYGAKSRFSFNQRPGIFVAQAAVHTEHTAEALKAMLADIELLAREGLHADELDKTRLLARSDLVEAFEGVDAAAARLARNAGLGLPPDHEAKASVAVNAATKEELAKLASEYLDLSDSVVVIVGPRAKLEPHLASIGMKSFETAGPEGD